jgi:hypothetical protein
VHRIANTSILRSDLISTWHVINIIQCSVLRTNKKKANFLPLRKRISLYINLYIYIAHKFKKNIFHIPRSHQRTLKYSLSLPYLLLSILLFFIITYVLCVSNGRRHVKASLIFLEESFLPCYFCLACIRSELAELQCLAPGKVSQSIE